MRTPNASNLSREPTPSHSNSVTPVARQGVTKTPSASDLYSQPLSPISPLSPNSPRRVGGRGGATLGAHSVDGEVGDDDKATPRASGGGGGGDVRRHHKQLVQELDQEEGVGDDATPTHAHNNNRASGAAHPPHAPPKLDADDGDDGDDGIDDDATPPHGHGRSAPYTTQHSAARSVFPPVSINTDVPDGDAGGGGGDDDLPTPKQNHKHQQRPHTDDEGAHHHVSFDATHPHVYERQASADGTGLDTSEVHDHPAVQSIFQGIMQGQELATTTVKTADNFSNGITSPGVRSEAVARQLGAPHRHPNPTEHAEPSSGREIVSTATKTAEPQASEESPTSASTHASSASGVTASTSSKEEAVVERTAGPFKMTQHESTQSTVHLDDDNGSYMDANSVRAHPVQQQQQQQ